MTTTKPDWMKPTEAGTILAVNRRSYPDESMPAGYVNIIVVLVLGDINDYAAYIAGGRDIDFARRVGNKLSFEEACIYFPGDQLEEARYRS